MAGLNALSGMSAQQIQALNKQYMPKLSLGGPQGSMWGAGKDGGFVWHGQGPAPQMTKDQILADMGYMNALGGWNPNGGGLQDPNNPRAQQFAAATQQAGQQPGQQAGQQVAGAVAGSGAGQMAGGMKTGLYGAEDALQGGLRGALAGLEGGVAAAEGTLNPYTSAGKGASNLQAALSGALGPEAQRAAFANYNESPEVAYMRQQGEKAILRNAAATGGTQGGNVLQALQRHGLGLAQQDYANSFNRLGSLADRGQSSANLLGGIQANAGMKAGDYAYGTGGQLAQYRTRAGENIANNYAGTTSALSGLINQQGTDLANIIGQGGGNIAQLLASYGQMSAEQQQQLATLLANIATGSASTFAGASQLPNVNDGEMLGGIGNLLGGIGAVMSMI